MDGSLNSTGLVGSTKETELTLSRIRENFLRSYNPLVILLCMVSVIGFVGNTLVLLVYGLMFKPTPTRVFVLYIASLNLFTSTVSIPLQIYIIRNTLNIDFYMCRIFMAMSLIPTQSASFVLVIIAFDRYRRICTPFRSQLQHSNAARITAGSVILSAVLFTPFIPLYGTHSVYTNESSKVFVICWWIDEYNETSYLLFYKITVAAVFGGCMITILMCYIRIWRKPQKSERTSSSSPRFSGSNSFSVSLPPKFSVMAMTLRKVVSLDRTPDDSRISETQNKNFLHAARLSSRSSLVMFLLSILYVVFWLPHMIARIIIVHPAVMCSNMSACGTLSYSLADSSFYFISTTIAFVSYTCSSRFRMECRALYRKTCKKTGARIRENVPNSKIRRVSCQRAGSRNEQKSTATANNPSPT